MAEKGSRLLRQRGLCLGPILLPQKQPEVQGRHRQRLPNQTDWDQNAEHPKTLLHSTTWQGRKATFDYQPLSQVNFFRMVALFKI